MTVSTVPKTVLIIDDEPSIVDLLKDILESANYRAIGVVKWTDAVDAIGMARLSSNSFGKKPSLILLDLKMHEKGCRFRLSSFQDSLLMRSRKI